MIKFNNLVLVGNWDAIISLASSNDGYTNN